MPESLTNGGKTLSATFQDLLTGASGEEVLLQAEFFCGSSADAAFDMQRHIAAQSADFTLLSIPVTQGDPVFRRNITLRAGDILRARHNGTAVTVVWDGEVREVTA